MEQRGNQGSVRRIVLAVVILLLLILTAGAYVYGMIFFERHFLPGTQINGFDCSFKRADEAENLIGREIMGYALAIETMNNGREALGAEEIGLRYAPDGQIEALLSAQDHVLWFRHLGDGESYRTEKEITFDPKLMEKKVDSLHCMQKENIEESSDAYLLDKGEGVYEIVPEYQGNEPDREKVYEVISNAVLSQALSVSLVETDCYMHPKIYRDNPVLLENQDLMTRIYPVIITYDFGDRTEQVDREVFMPWITADPEGRYVFDENLVYAYVSGLGAKYDTVGNTREFLTYDNRRITIQGGDYGWVIDREGETRGLIEAIEQGEICVREPLYAQSGFFRGYNDIGATYLEIDREAQRIVFYREGYPFVDCDVVTGYADENGSCTPTGVYYVRDKLSPPPTTEDVLWSGQSDAQWYVAFTDTLGIQDAPWRMEFGGQCYLFEGTGGGVDVPWDAMQSIYTTIEPGTPVVIY